MKIDDWQDSPYRDSSIIKDCEKDTFCFLSSNPRVREKFPQLSSKAKLQYDALSSRKKAKIHNINFESFFDVTCSRRDLRIHVGSRIVNDFSQITYYLFIGTKNRRGKYIPKRKFHFDYAKCDKRYLKPIFHLQYAGEMSSGLKGYEESYNQILFPELSQPRIYSIPMTLAILLNKLFKEFRCEDTHKIVEDSVWRGVIAKHEKIFIKPYHKQCVKFFERHHQAAYLFTTDFCYGKESTS